MQTCPMQLLMVMEYCEAGALVGPGTLTPERHLPEAMAQYYFRQMAAGLAYLHDNHGGCSAAGAGARWQRC
jgi:serine/threonine protein kinase